MNNNVNVRTTRDLGLVWKKKTAGRCAGRRISREKSLAMGHKESTSRGHVRGIHISMICTLCHTGTQMFIFTCMNTYISSSHAIGRGSSEGPTMKAMDRSNMTGLLRKRERRCPNSYSQSSVVTKSKTQNPKRERRNHHQNRHDKHKDAPV